ncbi:hypothetical protein PF005_g9005 [Phytophthora fragariae]|uniref:Flavodoxin-like domain-containing protein n=1 Tax=Phytophthora fragariae TaxID=53985 RepID=A0A6A3F8R0_9STRA|nr:hypothetical protein PF003_g11445 [Phytophthora fragariae]KAE8940190.1 hypothetical protein PF009_g9989 [Phytophthora fragariae]KAE9014697.1 hypothetical protein PF011_g7943 [Phytophthora fragariae]KAE9118180.1 hypothetical protein PF010_g8312 [Phytophthora fragariae]KAE9118986.1 hypothetical protein PF007_g8724 [Phytophthora fragariae]
MTNVAMIYSYMYGHVAKLASSLKAGVTAVPGVKASVYHVHETLYEDNSRLCTRRRGRTYPLPHRTRSRTPTAFCWASRRASACCRRRSRGSSTPVGVSGLDAAFSSALTECI